MKRDVADPEGESPRGDPHAAVSPTRQKRPSRISPQDRLVRVCCGAVQHGMRLVVRTLLLLIAAFSLAVPMASGSDARGLAGVASKPCPSRIVLDACIADTVADKATSRSSTVADGSCIGKAINTYAASPAAPSACAAFAFDLVPASWASRSPSIPTPPPRR